MAPTALWPKTQRAAGVLQSIADSLAFAKSFQRSSDMYRKKLIEVALPLEAINQGSKPETENPFLKGHPRAIHNWWARTPLSVSRAILFAQLIDDPGNDLPPPQA